MNRARLCQVLYVAANATLFGCGDPLIAPELITNTRVLAARTEAAGDAGRAWVMPSEAAHVRWLVAGPTGPVPLAWSFSACVAESVSRGLPICVAPAFAQSTSSELSPSEPQFDFTMPDQATLGTARHVAVAATFCASGAPTLDASGVEFTKSTCSDASEKPLFATVDVQVAPDASANANPDFDRIPLQFDETEWSAWSEPVSSTGCADPALTLPRVAADGASHTVRLGIPSDMSEPLPQITAHSAARETLSLAHFTTAGDLERAYSDVNVASDPAPVSVSWKTPTAAAANGELVRFYFVLRDGRGGADFTERAVCILP